MSSLDVKKIRALTGKSQTEFAELLGVTRSSVTLWETTDLDRRTKPKLSLALKMREIQENNNVSKPGLTPGDHNEEEKGFSDLKIDEKLDKLYGMLKRIEESGEGTKNRVNRTEQLISETNKNLLKQSMDFRDFFEELEEKTKKGEKIKLKF